MFLSKAQPSPGRRAAKGFSLIEALIAMLLFTIGFLAIGALQLRGMQAARISFQRSTVVNLVDGFADRIVANRQALALNRTIYSDTSGDPPQCYNSGVTCTALQVARNDFEQFNDALTDTGLQNLQMQVCYDDTVNDVSAAAYATCDNDGDSTLAIKVQWDSFDTANTGEATGTNSNLVYLPVTTVPP